MMENVHEMSQQSYEKWWESPSCLSSSAQNTINWDEASVFKLGQIEQTHTPRAAPLDILNLSNEKMFG